MSPDFWPFRMSRRPRVSFEAWGCSGRSAKEPGKAVGSGGRVESTVVARRVVSRVERYIFGALRMKGVGMLLAYSKIGREYMVQRMLRD